MAIAEIDVTDLADRVGEGALVIDVRESDEYETGHVPGAISVPLATVPDHLDRFAADATTYVICQAGARSMRAAEYAADEGLSVINVVGGTGAWVAAGNDVVVGAAPS